MGNILSWFSNPKQESVYNPEGNYFLGTRDDPRHHDYGSFGGNNKTKKNDKNDKNDKNGKNYKKFSKKSFKRKK
jgi:hypothetical protein